MGPRLHALARTAARLVSCTAARLVSCPVPCPVARFVACPVPCPEDAAAIFIFPLSPEAVNTTAPRPTLPYTTACQVVEVINMLLPLWAVII